MIRGLTPARHHYFIIWPAKVFYMANTSIDYKSPYICFLQFLLKRFEIFLCLIVYNINNDLLIRILAFSSSVMTRNSIL